MRKFLALFILSNPSPANSLEPVWWSGVEWSYAGAGPDDDDDDVGAFVECSGLVIYHRSTS